MEMLVHRCRTLREGAAQHRVDAVDLPSTRTPPFPSDTRPLRQLMTKVAVVEGGCRTDVSEQSSSVHRRPQTIGALGHVGHDEVRV